MLTDEGMQKARLRVTRIDEYLEAMRLHRPQRAALAERGLGWGNMEFMIHGHTGGPWSHPYPGPHGDGGPIGLRRDQTEHLVVELLKKLAPGGKLPTDAAELLDFVASVIHNGSAPV